jgi:hypothetical protein
VETGGGRCVVVCIALLSSLFASPSLLHALARFGPTVADAHQMSQPPEVTREHDAQEVPVAPAVVPGTRRRQLPPVLGGLHTHINLRRYGSHRRGRHQLLNASVSQRRPGDPCR